MRYVILLCLFAFQKSFAQEYTITVTVTNLKSADGKVAVAIYNSKDDFMGKKNAVRTFILPSVVGEKKIIVPRLAAGQYVIAVYHDKNGNGELDKNGIGAPTEPYGFSNDARRPFGPPPYDDCIIQVNGNSDFRIRVK